MTTHKTEREELALLTGEGFSFSVETAQAHKPLSLVQRLGRLFGRKPSAQPTKLHYSIKPPTLGTLLRISRVGLELEEIHLEEGSDTEVFARSWQCLHASADKMAEVVALAILGREPERRELHQLRHQLLEALTAQDLYSIIQRLYLCCNLADFINSTRLVQTSRLTARGQRVES